MAAVGCAGTRAAAPASPPRPWAELALADLGGGAGADPREPPGAGRWGQPDFARWEAEGYQAALAYARAASSLDGYAAALQRYLGAFRDGHLYVSTVTSRQPARWPGVVIASRGGRFVVARRRRTRRSSPPCLRRAASWSGATAGPRRRS
jgi:hypothetical protein